MAQYKLTLLGKTVILVLVFAAVMLVVTISTLSYDDNPPREAPPTDAVTPASPGITEVPPTSQSTAGPEAIPASQEPSQKPEPTAANTPLPANTPAPTKTPSADSTVLAPPSKQPVDSLLKESAVIYFPMLSSEPDDSGLAEIQRFISLPGRTEDYILVITANASPDESADALERQTLSRDRALSAMEYIKTLGMSEKHMTIVLNHSEIMSGDPDTAALSRSVELHYIINMK